MLRVHSTSFMCVCVHHKLCELCMRRLFIADLYVGTLAVVAVVLAVVAAVLAAAMLAASAVMLAAVLAASAVMLAAAMAVAAVFWLCSDLPRPRQKRRRHVAPPEKKRGVDYDAPPGCFFTLRFQLLTFQKAEQRSFFLFALL